MRAGLIDDFIRNILSVPFCPCHFVHAILSNTILPVYHFVHTILSVPFCPLPFCPRTLSSTPSAKTHRVEIAFEKREVRRMMLCTGVSVPKICFIHYLL